MQRLTAYATFCYKANLLGHRSRIVRKLHNGELTDDLRWSVYNADLDQLNQPNRLNAILRHVVGADVHLVTTPHRARTINCFNVQCGALLLTSARRPEFDDIASRVLEICLADEPITVAWPVPSVFWIESALPSDFSNAFVVGMPFGSPHERVPGPSFWAPKTLQMILKASSYRRLLTMEDRGADMRLDPNRSTLHIFGDAWAAPYWRETCQAVQSTGGETETDTSCIDPSYFEDELEDPLLLTKEQFRDYRAFIAQLSDSTVGAQS